MNAAMLHRGPDGEGSFSDSHAALAMRRLSIIDLETGWQPLYSEDRSIVVVCNGEIYNYVELRDELSSRGHVFRTRSDAETIVHAYEESGLEFVHRLRGMFALAVWDTRARRLVLARDRMGEKPLYLRVAGGRLSFASELKALLAGGEVPFELDPEAVKLYWHFQYVPEPLTAVRGVRKLDAASMLIVDVDGWKVSERSYWAAESAPPLAGNPVERIRAELEAVARLTVRSDVPVGIALSGGLDSSALGALAARAYPGTMHAFSVGYEGRPPCDERHDARECADALGLPFHEIEVRTADVVASFDTLNAQRDDPIADIAGYGYFAVMALARQCRVPVVLQGQGGDELFWGYGWVRRAARETARKMRLRGGAWREALSYLGADPGGFDGRALVRDLCGPAGDVVFYDLNVDFRDARAWWRRRRGPSDCVLPSARPGAALPAPDGPHGADVRITRLICDSYLRENGITQGDRLSMASSIELRLPLLDHRLVETVIGLRKGCSDLGEEPKTWLRRAVCDLLPTAVVDRVKRGFTPPVLEWHRALFKAHGERLVDGFLVGAGVLSRREARQLAAGVWPDLSVVAPISFKALVLESWCRAMYSRRS